MVYDANLHYLGIGNISLGIEFLGACLDEYPFNKSGESKKRFKIGIEHFLSKIDPRYSKFNQRSSPYYLYKNLRCGMAHVIRPQGKVHFTSRKESKSDGTKHLCQSEGRLILVCEDFYDHFAQSCKMLIEKLPTLTNIKIKEPYLTIVNHN